MPEDASQIKETWIIALRGIHGVCYSSQAAAPSSACQSILYLSLGALTFHPALLEWRQPLVSIGLLKKRQAHTPKKGKVIEKNK